MSAAPPPSDLPTTAPTRRVIPAPSGPNWSLVLGSLTLLAGAGCVLGWLAGIRISLDVALPTVLVAAGVMLVLVGQIGLIVKRRRC